MRDTRRERASFPFVQPDPPVRGFFLASAGGGGPVKLVPLDTLFSVKPSFLRA